MTRLEYQSKFIKNMVSEIWYGQVDGEAVHRPVLKQGQRKARRIPLPTNLTR